MSGKVELIIGCMFSGKTTELLRLIKRYESVNKKIMIINYKDDIRYGNDNMIYTHDKNGKEALHISDLTEINNNSLYLRQYLQSDIIFINEGQFFKHLYDFVIQAADNDHKTVIVCGLDGDYERKPFGDILRLIPLSDNVTRLHALCKLCNDGTPGIFTKRTINSDIQELIGGEDTYMPVCRKHYLCNECDLSKETISLKNFGDMIEKKVEYNLNGEFYTI